MIISPNSMSTSLSTQDCFAHVIHQFLCISYLIIYVLLLSSILQYVVNHVRTAYFERRLISSIRHLLTTEATATLTSANILSRLE